MLNNVKVWASKLPEGNNIRTAIEEENSVKEEQTANNMLQ
jgi:hypothetical protein